MKELGTDQLCKGKKVVMFAVPGAFTPTCSMKHLPGFIEKADEIKVGSSQQQREPRWLVAQPCCLAAHRDAAADPQQHRTKKGGGRGR